MKKMWIEISGKVENNCALSIQKNVVSNQKKQQLICGFIQSD